jgi:hypothetical protein
MVLSALKANGLILLCGDEGRKTVLMGAVCGDLQAERYEWMSLNSYTRIDHGKSQSGNIGGFRKSTGALWCDRR